MSPTAVTAPRPAPSRIVEIRPSKGLFDLELGTLWQYRELLYVLVLRDLKVRYKQAALGVAWVIVQPLLAVLIFTAIFGIFAKMPSDGVPYPIFAYAAMLPWQYFAESMRRWGMGLVTDAELVRKIYFPRLIIPLAAVIAPLVDFSIAFLVLLGMMVWYDIPFTWHLLMIVPLVCVAAAFALAVGLWLGPVNVRYRDVVHTLPFIIQIGLYASPIVYPLSMVPEQWRALYSLNPMVGVIEGFRWAILGTGSLPVSTIAMSACTIAAVLLAGLVYFKRMERSFADLI